MIKKVFRHPYKIAMALAVVFIRAVHRLGVTFQY